MATYKVIQDIEAEDKFLGPLTLKQFIFGAGAIFFGYLGFFAVTKGAAFLLAIFLPPAFLGAFLAIPWSSEQSTEVWVVAKLRFLVKPKARIWDQSGQEDLVTITVPKKIERQLTNGLDQEEVHSRLKALAETIDTRGWAVKNAGLGGYSTQVSDRLINPVALPQEVQEDEQYDAFDENTAVSENLERMIDVSTEMRRQQSLEKMERIRRGEPLESIQQPEIHLTPPSESYAEGLDEQLLSRQLRSKRDAQDMASSHMQRFRTLPTPGTQTSIADPGAVSATILPAQPLVDDPAQQAQPRSTAMPESAILNLAQNNDLNVATIARQVKKAEEGDGEVVISLR